MRSKLVIFLVLSLSSHQAWVWGQESTIRSIEVETNPIFDPADAENHLLYRLINWSHWTTKESTVRKELWLNDGDTYDDEDLREIERELRNTGLFAEAEVSAEGGDLNVDTSDLFSLRLAFLSSFAGEVGSYGVLLGDRNLFGSGNDIRFQAEFNDNDEEILSVDYLDRHFLDSAVQMRTYLGTTEEGDFYTGSFTKPFRHLEDPWAWSVSAASTENAVDFFEEGESAAEIPRKSLGFGSSITRGYGPRDARRRLGLSFGADDIDYGAPEGEDAEQFTAPIGVRRLSLTPSWGVNVIRARETVRDLDTIDYTQDIELGWFPSMYLGGQLRDEEDNDTELHATAGVGLRSANRIGERSYLTTSSSAAWRGDADRSEGWFASSAVHAYHRIHPRHLIATSWTYDQAFEGEGIPAQLTLGEDNGLRGYPARQFSGTRRVRVNLEDRIKTDWEFRSFHLGLVGIVDAGYIDGDGAAPDDILASAGLGFRLGSSEWYGGDVLRFDLSFPITSVDGLEEKPLFSVALGQVFGFFGNSNTLPAR